MPTTAWTRHYNRARRMGMNHFESIRYADRLDTLEEEHGESYLRTAASELRVALNGALNCENCGGTGVAFFSADEVCDCRVLAKEILLRHSTYLDAR